MIYSTGAKYLHLCVAGKRDLLRSLFQVILLDIEIDGVYETGGDVKTDSEARS